MPSLDYFKTHPLRVARNQRALPLGQARGAEKASASPVKIHPTAGAYIHYGGVELADRLYMLKPPMSDDELTYLTKVWYESCGAVAKQLIYYLLGIISKELRHGTKKMCGKAFGAHPVAPYAKSMCEHITEGAWETVLDANPHVPIGEYVDAVEIHYRYGGWTGSFGGKKWADIALVLKQYLDGVSSAMIACDRAWTLVHNTGPIFNKGFYFHYHDDMLATVLNHQATNSVFTLGSPSEFLTGNKTYGHVTSDRFIAFADAALKAIHQVDPDYSLGQGGSVNSDGTAVVDTGLQTSGPSGATTTTHLGPVAIYTTSQRGEV